MDKYTAITITVILAYLIFSTYTQIKINKSALLNTERRKINTRLNWLIPFIGSALIMSMIKLPKFKVTTKKDRKIKTGSNLDETIHG